MVQITKKDRSANGGVVVVVAVAVAVAAGMEFHRPWDGSCCFGMWRYKVYKSTAHVDIWNWIVDDTVDGSEIRLTSWYGEYTTNKQAGFHTFHIFQVVKFGMSEPSTVWFPVEMFPIPVILKNGEPIKSIRSLHEPLRKGNLTKKPGGRSCIIAWKPRGDAKKPRCGGIKIRIMTKKLVANFDIILMCPGRILAGFPIVWGPVIFLWAFRKPKICSKVFSMHRSRGMTRDRYFLLRRVSPQNGGWRWNWSGFVYLTSDKGRQGWCILNEEFKNHKNPRILQITR